MVKYKLLIVDDQPGIRLLLTEMFTHHGYDVWTAETGHEALGKLQNHSFDLVILDYKLPHLDGLQVIQRLEKENCTVPLILMSGLTEKLKQEDEQYDMIKKIVPKPFDVQKLYTLVQSILVG